MGRRKRRMQDAKRPLLSIFVSVYNLENYIEECLDSILQQPFQDYEILLFDNGSIDRSIEICTGYAQRYPDKIRYYKLPLPTVVGRPHHLACTRMRGRYFMQIDGDDYLASGALQQISDAILKHRPDIVTGSFVSDVEPNAINRNDAIFEPEKINDVPYEDAVAYLSELPQFHIAPWRYILKRHIIPKFATGKSRLHRKKRINKKRQILRNKNDIPLYCKKRYNWNLSVHGEAKLIVTIFESGQSIYFLEKPFYVYRQRTGSISALPLSMLSGNLLAGARLLTILWIVKWNRWEKRSAFRNKICIEFMELYRQLCFLNTSYEESQMAEVIRAYKKSLQHLKNCDTTELHALYEQIQLLGAERGLASYREQQTEKLMVGCKGFCGKSVYVFPTGFCGEATAELLAIQGISVTGFLDNDPSKDGITIRDKTCCIPQKLQGYTDKEKKNTAVIIATSYPKLSPALRDQLVGIGIPEENIYIR